MVSLDSRYVDNIDSSGTVNSVKAVNGIWRLRGVGQCLWQDKKVKILKRDLPHFTDAGLCWLLSTGCLGTHTHSGAMGVDDRFCGAGVLKP